MELCLALSQGFLAANMCAVCVVLQGDWVWLGKECLGEFDVDIGGQVKGTSGGNIHIVDDDKKVSSIFVLHRLFPNSLNFVNIAELPMQISWLI